MTIRGRSSVLDAAASADAPRRVLTVMPRVVLEMQGISLTGGYLVPGQARGAGASVAPEATLLLDDCHVYANRHVSGATGGIVVSGALCADHCTIYNNQVASDRVLSQGGGLNIDREGVANLTGTNVTGNLVTSSGTGSARGGGVFNNGRLLAVRCTIEYNKAASVGGIVQGGGLENSGQARLIETAVEHNMATSASGNLVAGAGIFNNVDATLMLERSIIKHNLGKSLERQVLGGGLNTRGDATLTDSIIAHNSAIGSLFTAGGGISSGFEGLLIITSCNITGNIVQGAETVMGGGLFHVSLRRAFLIGSLVANNSVTGGDGSGHQIFNAANLSYVMAAPLGRWLSGTVECPVAPVQCPGGDECPNQPCDVASHPWLVGRHLTSLMGGPTDSDYPPACEPGSYAVDDSIAEQSFPTCSGLCAALDPSSTTEHAGAIGQASCSCSKGFFLATATSGVCEACPAGATSCAEIGSTLASLELTPGHWRLSESTADIRDCTGGMRVGPDVRTGTGTGTAAGNTTRIITTCRGGSDSSDYCAAGLAGPLCRVCAEPDHFLDVARAACERCPATGVAALWLPALIGLLLLLLPLLWMLREYLVEAVGLWWSSSLCLVSVQQSTALVRSLGLVAIAKLLVAYFQVVAVLPEVYAVTLPPEYLEAMESLKWISLDWLSLVHVSCLGDFQDRLQISAFLPLALLALVFACGVLVTLANERACSLAAVRRGLLTGLPPTLVICFALVPSVSSRLFSAFSCEAFGYDDAAGKSRSFLFVDYAVECDASDEYAALTSLATVLLLLWPIGVPLLFLVLLWSHGTAAQAARGAAEAPLSKAVAFLHREYTSSMRYWELLELARKLTLTGFMLLVPQQYSLLRLVLALLLTVGHMALLLHGKPYTQPLTAFFAFTAAFTLACTFLVALLLRVHEQLPAGTADRFFGGELGTVPLAMLIFGFNLVVVAAGLGLTLGQLREETHKHMAQLLRYAKDGARVSAPLLPAKDNTHLFLSHVWSTGQDQMRIVKQRLLEMIPELRVFLDVDDLVEIGDLESYIELTSAVLVFCSAGYAESKNCVREARHAVANAKPLIALFELEKMHGGLTMAAMREQLIATERQRFRSWGFAPVEPGGAAIADALEAHEPIEWNRLKDFQAVTLRLIATRLLHHAAQPVVYVQDEVVNSRHSLQPLDPGAFHLYCSPHNPGAVALAAEVAAARLNGLSYSERPGDLVVCESMLLYLTAHTWKSVATTSAAGTAGPGAGDSRCGGSVRFNPSGNSSELESGGEGGLPRLSVGAAPTSRGALAAEVATAMRGGVRLLLAHETPGFGQEGRCAIEFARFFDEDQTPSELVAAGVYSTLAVSLKGREWRATSLALLARAIEGGHVTPGMFKRLARMASSMRLHSRVGSRAQISMDGGGGSDEESIAGRGERRGRPQLSDRDSARLIEMASARRSGGSEDRL